MKPVDLEVLIEIFGKENVILFDEVKEMNGTIARIMSDKRFGFIKGEDNKDYFFHATDLNGFWEDLVQDVDGGRKIVVTFDVVPSPKGPRAGNVVRDDSGV
jgi:cold shock CspA family protein